MSSCLSCNKGLSLDKNSGNLICDECGNSYTVDEDGGSNTRNFACARCSHEMFFDKSTEELICDNCSFSISINDYDQVSYLTPFNTTNTDFHVSTGVYDDTLVQEYQCENCHSTFVIDKHNISAVCSFCCSSISPTKQSTQNIAPLKVILFQISISTAQKLFEKWCGKKMFTPSSFKSSQIIDTIRGVYVPFWFFDLESQGELFATSSSVYVRRFSSHEYTTTTFYKTYCQGQSEYLKIPADASRNLNDEMMDKLEPFDYTELTNFDTTHLFGYNAEQYSYTAQDVFPRIKERASEYLFDYLRSRMWGYTSVYVDKFNVDVIQKSVTSVLLPVYLLDYSFKGETYRFAINGQTGKIVGDPPISSMKVFLWFIIFSSMAYFLLDWIWTWFSNNA